MQDPSIGLTGCDFPVFPNLRIFLASKFRSQQISPASDCLFCSICPSQRIILASVRMLLFDFSQPANFPPSALFDLSQSVSPHSPTFGEVCSVWIICRLLFRLRGAAVVRARGVFIVVS